LVFKCCGPRLKNCRGDELGVIEPFRGDDLPPPSFPKSFIGNPRFCLSFVLKPWTPDRNIQGQAKNGLKIAGVTRRWESKGFLPLNNLEPFRGDR